MNERTELTERDRQLLDEIEEIVANGGGERREADSLYGFCAHLASTVPHADDAFRQRLEARLVAKLRQQQQEARKGNRGSIGRYGLQRWVPLCHSVSQVARPAVRTSLVVCVIIVLVLGLLVSVPTTRAALLDMVQRLGFVLAQPGQLESSTVVQVEMEEEEPPISLAEAQQRVPFPIRTPTWLPEGLTLLGAYTGSRGDQADMVSLFYGLTDESPASRSAGMSIVIASSPDQIDSLVPILQVEEVVVNNHKAIYVQGAWQDDGLRWDETADVTRLSWEEDGLTYLLTVYGLSLKREDVIRIAESLK